MKGGRPMDTMGVCSCSRDSVDLAHTKAGECNRPRPLRPTEVALVRCASTTDVPAGGHVRIYIAQAPRRQFPRSRAARRNLPDASPTEFKAAKPLPH
eukprot:scaffold539_cov359-Prasinococcus_capsulatus_cf.AAC.24